MTTLDSLTSFAERVEQSAARRAPIDWRRVFIALLSALPYMLGKFVGHVTFCVRVMAAASREGYYAASAPAAHGRRPQVATIAAPSSVDG